MTHAREEYERQVKAGEAQRQLELGELQANFERKYQRFKEFQIDIERINAEM